MEINPEVIQINRKKIQINSYVVSVGDEMVIIFDDSDNKTLFEYKTVNDYETCGNVEKRYKNSSLKFNAAKIGTRYFSTSKTCEKSTRFQIKTDPTSTANISDSPATAPPTSNTDRSYTTPTSNTDRSYNTNIIGFFAWSLFLFL